MYIRQQAQPVFLLDGLQHGKSFFESRTAKGVQARPVRLVKARLEDNVYRIFPVQPHEFSRNSVKQFRSLDDTGTCNENWFIHHILEIYSSCFAASIEFLPSGAMQSYI